MSNLGAIDSRKHGEGMSQTSLRDNGGIRVAHTGREKEGDLLQLRAPFSPKKVINKVTFEAQNCQIGLHAQVLQCHEAVVLHN
jgi:hypothetical protein